MFCENLLGFDLEQMHRILSGRVSERSRCKKMKRKEWAGENKTNTSIVTATHSKNLAKSGCGEEWSNTHQTTQEICGAFLDNVPP